VSGLGASRSPPALIGEAVAPGLHLGARCIVVRAGVAVDCAAHPRCLVYRDDDAAQQRAYGIAPSDWRSVRPHHSLSEVMDAVHFAIEVLPKTCVSAHRCSPDRFARRRMQTDLSPILRGGRRPSSLGNGLTPLPEPEQIKLELATLPSSLDAVQTALLDQIRLLVADQAASAICGRPWR